MNERLILGVYGIEDSKVKKITNSFDSELEIRIINNASEINDLSTIEMPDIVFLRNNEKSKMFVDSLRIEKKGVALAIFCLNSKLDCGHIYFDASTAKNCSRYHENNSLEIHNIERIAKEIRKNKIKLSFLESLVDMENIKFFLEIIDLWDSYTKGHCERTKRYAEMLAYHLELSAPEIMIISNAALIHDIGKISVPKSILSNNRKLTDEEYSVIKNHSIYADNFLVEKKFEYIRKLINQHHENYDGTGYPFHLSKDEIEKGSYLISLVDSFDAMTTPRGYNRVKTFDQAIDEIIKCSGKQFNPEMVDSFIELSKSSEFSNYYKNEVEQMNKKVLVNKKKYNKTTII